MELCGPNMNDRGASLCQVKQLPSHSGSICRLQASAGLVHSLPHQPWVNHTEPALVSSPTVALRHRVSGATAASCSGADCAASKVREDAAVVQGVSAGKVLVTGGGGYVGFRLGKELVRQGMSVVLLDLNKPPSEIPDGATFYQVCFHYDLCPHLTAAGCN